VNVTSVVLSVKRSLFAYPAFDIVIVLILLRYVSDTFNEVLIICLKYSLSPFLKYKLGVKIVTWVVPFTNTFYVLRLTFVVGSILKSVILFVTVNDVLSIVNVVFWPPLLIVNNLVLSNVTDYVLSVVLIVYVI